MRTIEVKLYKFEELSPKAKDAALQRYSQINVNDDWWTPLCEDAMQVGIEISEFDIYDRTINIKLTDDAEEVARLIMEDHGETCNSYQTAVYFMQDRDKLVARHSDGINLEKVAEGKEDEFDNDMDKLIKEFTTAIGKDYLNLLREEYEYLISDEIVAGALIESDYEFTEDGKEF